MYVIKKNNDDKWIIIKKGNKRATRAFNSKSEAILYAEAKYKGNYEIEDEYSNVRDAAKATKKVAKKHPKVFWTIFTIICIGVIVFLVLYFMGIISFKGKDDSNPNDGTGTVEPGNPGTNEPGSGSTATTPIDPNALIVDDVLFDEFQIHMLELGNQYTGDSIFIKAGDNDILIDAGSRKGSAQEALIPQINALCDDGILEYVIVTHSDQDHISGMPGSKKATKNYKNEEIPRDGILYYYDVEVIIDYSRTNKSKPSQVMQEYNEAVTYAVSKGATHYTAEECWNETNGALKHYKLSDVMDISMDILYNKYYFEVSNDENDHSVVTMFNYNDHHFLLTGDLEKKGEEAFVAYYDGTTAEKTLPEVDFYKAGHHGSYSSSNDKFLDLIKPKISAASCVAGATEYSKNYKNVFPSQDYINRISKYTDRVYVTTMVDYKKTIEAGSDVIAPLNGQIVISSNGSQIGISASNNTTKLKDSEWFNQDIYVLQNEKGDYLIEGKDGYYTKDTPNAILKKMRTWPSAM